jgi:2-aminoadipate transaminase
MNDTSYGDVLTLRLATRMQSTPRSFIREILKVTERPDIISFAGGLPNPSLFDIEGLGNAANDVIVEEGNAALQYTTTEGYFPLRKYIAERYRTRLGLNVAPEEILITNGSQQALDLVGKCLIDAGDTIAIERPGYLGAIQVFSLYQPIFSCIPLENGGPDIGELEKTLANAPIRFFYGVPNSQNPSGVTYTTQARLNVADALRESDAIFVEDDAYGELRFAGPALPSLRSYLPDRTVICGSFSKIIAPGLRLGWVCAPPSLMEPLVTAKQATDLHSNHLAQRIAARYLEKACIDDHIRRITTVYNRQMETMTSILAEELPSQVMFTKPDGGMFLWVTLPECCSAMELFRRALHENVAILPGVPFYIDGGGDRSIRLNFSNADEERIVAGMERLTRVIRMLVHDTGIR